MLKRTNAFKLCQSQKTIHLETAIFANTRKKGLRVRITDFSVERNDDDETAKPRVPDDLLKKIAGLCVQVEDVFGSPQDIEWTAGIEVTYSFLRLRFSKRGVFFSRTPRRNDDAYHIIALLSYVEIFVKNAND